jgi:hypothetical protein
MTPEKCVIVTTQQISISHQMCNKMYQSTDATSFQLYIRHLCISWYLHEQKILNILKCQEKKALMFIFNFQPLDLKNYMFFILLRNLKKPRTNCQCTSIVSSLVESFKTRSYNKSIKVSSIQLKLIWDIHCILSL